MKRFAFIASAIFLAACAGTTSYEPYPDLAASGADYASVHFLRKNSPYGAAIAAPIELDGRLVGKIGPGDALTIEVPAREVSISTSAGGVTLAAEHGQAYYYEIRLPFHGIIALDEFEILPISEEQAREFGLGSR